MPFQIFSAKWSDIGLSGAQMFGSLLGDWLVEGGRKPRNKSAWATLLIMSMTLTCVGARAQECKPLQYLGGMPLTVSEDGRIETDALINNVPTSVGLIPGSLNFVTHDAVKKFSLSEHASDAKMYNSLGEVSNTYAMASQFSIGPIAGSGVMFRVRGSDASEQPYVSLYTFAKFDIDFDFSSQRLNLFSSDHCESKVTYFSTGAVAAIPYQGDGFEIAVNLDGHATKAYLLGNRPESTMGLAEATKLFGLTSESPGMEPVLKNGDLVGYHHTFSKLSLEGITINNSAFLIIPEKIKDMFKEQPTGSHIYESPYKDARIEMAVGRNVQQQLHIYIATKEHKLYIAPGSEVGAKLLPPLKPARAQ
jgi:hypothetical protein